MNNPQSSEAPTDDYALAEEGKELLLEGEVDAAIAYLMELTAKSPQNPYAFQFLGDAFFYKSEHDKALKAYVSALSLSPRYLGAMLGAGHSLRLLGKLHEAVRMGKQILLAESSDGDAFYLLGLCHFSMGEHARAKEYFIKLLGTNPELEVDMEVRGLLDIIAGNVVASAAEEQEES